MRALDIAPALEPPALIRSLHNVRDKLTATQGNQPFRNTNTPLAHLADFGRGDRLRLIPPGQTAANFRDADFEGSGGTDFAILV